MNGGINRVKPDLIILDEAQRIKNFETKTAEVVRSLPRQHAIVLTGTPLENKLEDVYSLVQFLDPEYPAIRLRQREESGRITPVAQSVAAFPP